ncbi:MAG: dihydroorotate dehydrogenase electron transfer subunit [Clostridium sp.]|uniref:dihydroorotate dehydrogenase electron transfer subunit n=1 Tax=Clostridium sp. TaxID=1506 RepID=UPI003F2C4E07
MKFKKTEILSNEEISPSIYKMVVKEEESIKPGQFYMLKSEKAYLQRPISICEKEGEELVFLYAVVGEGTKDFSKMKKGEEITLTGPLGNGFSLDFNEKKVALVGGGIGVAPMLQVAKELKELDKEVNFYAGFRDEVYLTEDLKKYVNELKVSTNTGKHGHKGFVTEIFKPENYDVVLCCGPEIMMKRVVEMCKEVDTKVFVSMEKHMACGVGACLVCTCKTKEGNKRTCKDGPVFDGALVEF